MISDRNRAFGGAELAPASLGSVSSLARRWYFSGSRPGALQNAPRDGSARGSGALAGSRAGAPARLGSCAPRIPRPPRRSRARVASRRGAPARVKRGTWAPDADDAAADDVHDDAGAGAEPPTLDLDAEEAEETPAPAPAPARSSPGARTGWRACPSRTSPWRRRDDGPPSRSRFWATRCGSCTSGAPSSRRRRGARLRPQVQARGARRGAGRGVAPSHRGGTLRGRGVAGGEVGAQRELRQRPDAAAGKGKGGHAIYRNASALECVVGYLYMTDVERLEATMARLGGRGSWRQSRRRRRGGRDRSRGAGGSGDEGDGGDVSSGARTFIKFFGVVVVSSLAPRGRLPFSRDRVMRFALAPCC